MKKMLALAVVALVSACGGSSNDSPPSSPGEPNDSIATATQMTPGTPVVATIASGTDYDFYKFTVPTGGATVNFQTFDQGGTSCDPANNTVDTFLEVYNPSGTLVNWSDDIYNGPTWISWCEDFSVVLPAGTNYVAVSGYPPFPFNYTLKVNIP